MDIATKIQKWSIFSTLEPEFVTNLRMVCVFGTSGNEAYLINKDDIVFALGSNANGSLGLGDIHGCLEPRRVEILCKKSIKTFAYGSGPHVFALTGDGELFGWGHNAYCQVGNGQTAQVPTPTLINTTLTGKRLVDIACGSYHSLALTDEGEVYAWGQNNCGQIGSGTTTNQPSPRKISSGIIGRMVVAISCGQTSSMAVLDNGEVYGWGYNGNGQLGIGTNVNQSLPCKVVNLVGIVITQIVCGYAHTLALSDDGALYAWGANSYGQLGTCNKANVGAPQRIAAEIGRIVDIAATHYGHLSAFSSQLSRVYMFGQCRGQSIVMPFETNFSDLSDVFSCFSSPAVTPSPITLDISLSLKVTDSMRLAFDDSTTSDLTISVEDKKIYVHKAILKIRCEHFRSMFQNHWDEDSKDLLEISQFSFVVYRAFLHYLYTDYVILSPEDAIGLLDLANSYCETPLKKLSEKIIRQGITVDNAAMLYAAAIKYQAKELEQFCLRFCLNHLTAVAQTEAFGKLDEQILKNFLVRAAQLGAFKY